MDERLVDERDKRAGRSSAYVVQISPKDSVADVVQRFKGGTSRVLRKEFPELEEFLWGDSFWADGYFAETVGQVNEEIVKRHMRQQRGRP